MLFSQPSLASARSCATLGSKFVGRLPSMSSQRLLLALLKGPLVNRALNERARKLRSLQVTNEGKGSPCVS